MLRARVTRIPGNGVFLFKFHCLCIWFWVSNSTPGGRPYQSLERFRRFIKMTTFLFHLFNWRILKSTSLVNPTLIEDHDLPYNGMLNLGLYREPQYPDKYSRQLVFFRFHFFLIVLMNLYWGIITIHRYPDSSTARQRKQQYFID